MTFTMSDAGKITVLIVDSDGTRTLKDIDPKLEAFQSIVGGWIEAIGGVGWTAYLNEEGKIHGLPINHAADSLARTLGWRSLPGDVLVGPVVFCGAPDDDGYDTSVEPDVLTIAGI